MTSSNEVLNGVQLTDLERGAMLDIETKTRHYSAEYLGGDKVRISGHPQWCPTPTEVHLRGSLRNSGDFEPGFVGAGLHMVFERDDNQLPVTTTVVKELHVKQ